MTDSLTSVEVQVIDRQGDCRVDVSAIRELTERMLRRMGVESAEISVVFVDDPTIAELNQRFLNHDGPTDIITFPISSTGDERLEGELVISAPWAAKVAAENGDDLADELALYVAHGVLHLLGYDDLTPNDSEVMKRQERSLLESLGAKLPRGRFDALPVPDALG